MRADAPQLVAAPGRRSAWSSCSSRSRRSRRSRSSAPTPTSRRSSSPPSGCCAARSPGAVFGFGVGLFLDLALVQTLGLSLAAATWPSATGRPAARAARPARRARAARARRRGDRDRDVGFSLMQFLLGVDAPVSFLLLREILATILLNALSRCPSTRSCAAGWCPSCPRTRAAAAAAPTRPAASRRCTAHDRSRPPTTRRPPITPQLALRVAILGGVALALFAIVFFRLWFLQVLPATSTCRRRATTACASVRVAGAARRDRRPQRRVARRPTAWPPSSSSIPRSCRGRAQRRRGWGQLAGRRALRPKGKQGAPVAIPPLPRRPSCSALVDRLARVAGHVADDDPAADHQLAGARAVRERHGSRPTSRADAQLPRRAPELFPGVSVEHDLPAQLPAAATLAAQLLGTVGRDQPDRAQAEALPRRRRRARSSARPASSASTTSTCAAATARRDHRRRARAARRATAPGATPVPGRSCSSRSTSACSRRARRRSTRRSADPGRRRRVRRAWTRATARSSRWARARRFDPTCSRGRSRNADVQDSSTARTAAGRRAAVQPRDRRRLSDRLDLQADHRARRRWPSGVITPSTVDQRHRLRQIGREQRQFCNAERAAQRRGRPASARSGLLRRLLLQAGPRRSTRSGGQPLQKWARSSGSATRPASTCPARPAASSPTARGATRINRAEARCRAQEARARAASPTARAGRGPTGDNVNLAIGQGDLQATPLQMASPTRRSRTAAASCARTSASRSRTPTAACSSGSSRRPARKVAIDPADRQAIMPGPARRRPAERHLGRRSSRAGRRAATRSSARPAPPSAPPAQRPVLVRRLRPDEDQADRRRRDRRGRRLRRRRRRAGRRLILSKWFDVQGQVHRRQVGDRLMSPTPPRRRSATRRRRAASRAARARLARCRSTRCCCSPSLGLCASAR